MKGKSTRPSRDDLIRENEGLRIKYEAMRTSRLGSNVAAILRTLIKYVGIGGTIVWSVSFLAGHTTKLDAAIDLCGNLQDVVKELAPAWWLQLTTVAILGLGIRSNSRLRMVSRNQVKKISELTKDAERALDPERSSSGLGEDGETHERDAL